MSKNKDSNSVVVKRERIKQFYIDGHKEGKWLGKTWEKHFNTFINLFALSREKILDYGCGPNGGIKNKLGDQVFPYDPYVPKYKILPNDGFTYIFSCDVLEHLLKKNLNSTLSFFNSRPKLKGIFLVLSNRYSNKTIDQGLNCHLIVESFDWWLAKLECSFPEMETIYAQYDGLEKQSVFAFKVKQ